MDKEHGKDMDIAVSEESSVAGTVAAGTAAAGTAAAAAELPESVPLDSNGSSATTNQHQHAKIQDAINCSHPLETEASPRGEIQFHEEHEHEGEHEHEHEGEHEHEHEGDDEHAALLPNTGEPIKEKKDKDKEKKKKKKDKEKDKTFKESLSPAADETTSLLPKSTSPKTGAVDAIDEIHPVIESVSPHQDPINANSASSAVQASTTVADFMGVAAAQDLEKGEKKKKDKDKEEKRKGPKDDDIKTHMANERTFFKWLFFGFHIGAMGTFVLTFFSANTPGRVYMVAGVWVIAFFFVYYGLFRYFARRRALRLGLTSPTDWDDPAGPALMAGAMFLIVIAIVIFAILTDSVPTKGGWKHDEPGPTTPGDGSDTNPAEATPVGNDTDLIPLP